MVAGVCCLLFVTYIAYIAWMESHAKLDLEAERLPHMRDAAVGLT